MARCQRDIEVESQTLETEESVITNERGTKVMNAPVDDDDAALVEALAEHRDVLVDVAGRGANAVLDAARISAARTRTGADHLARLREAAPDMPILMVPELFTRATGRRVVTLVADALAGAT